MSVIVYLNVAGWVAYIAAAVVFALYGTTEGWSRVLAGWAAWNGALFVADILDGAGPMWSGGNAGCVIGVLLIWWWRRRKRRNVLSLVGAKSKALRDALVRKAREAAKPRPVLRPVPQGSP